MSASARTGGRLNPPGEFGAIYVSLDPDTPLRELNRQAAHAGVTVAALLPRILFTAGARLRRVVDLACGGGPEVWGLSPDALSGDDWSACQEVA